MIADDISSGANIENNNIRHKDTMTSRNQSHLFSLHLKIYPIHRGKTESWLIYALKYYSCSVKLFFTYISPTHFINYFPSNLQQYCNCRQSRLTVKYCYELGDSPNATRQPKPYTNIIYLLYLHSHSQFPDINFYSVSFYLTIYDESHSTHNLCELVLPFNEPALDKVD